MAAAVSVLKRMKSAVLWTLAECVIKSLCVGDTEVGAEKEGVDEEEADFKVETPRV